MTISGVETAEDSASQEHGSVIAAAQSLHDLHHLYLGSNNTYNFQLYTLHNFITMDSTSLEQSTGSNSIIYNGRRSSGNYRGVIRGSDGYVMPMGIVMADEGHGGFAENEWK